MALVGTILVGLALVVGVLNGARRGPIKEGMALMGVLLGALLITLWAERWGGVISRQTGWRPGIGQWVAMLVLLWGTALLAGYGSVALLPRRPERLSPVLRAGGALLGLLNGGLLIAFTLRYTQLLVYGESAATRRMTWIQMSPASRFLVERLDLILLGIAWVVAFASLGVTLVRLVGRLVSPQPRPTRGPPARPASGQGRAPDATTRAPSGQASAPAPDAPLFRDPAATPPAARPPGMEPSFIDKPRTPTGGSSG